MTFQPIDVFSLFCLSATVILFYYMLKPTDSDLYAGYGMSWFIEVLLRALFLIPLFGIWAVYFFIRWIFKV